MDLLADALDVDVHGPGVSDVLIAPDLIEELLSCEHPVRGGRKEVEEFQLLRGHVDVLSLVGDRVVREVDDKVRILDDLVPGVPCGGVLCGGRVVAAKHRLDPGNEFLRVKGLLHVVVRPELQSQHLVEDLALGGEHDDRHLGLLPDLPADLVAVLPGQHDVQENEVRLIGVEGDKRALAVGDDLRVVALLAHVERDQLRNVLIVIDDQDFLLWCSHKNSIPFP